MPWVGLEPRIPSFKRAKRVNALDRAATVIWDIYLLIFPAFCLLSQAYRPATSMLSIVMTGHPWFNRQNYGFSSCRWEAQYKIEVVIQISLGPFTAWTGYSINTRGQQHLGRWVSWGGTTPDSSLLFEVADMRLKNEHGPTSSVCV